MPATSATGDTTAQCVDDQFFDLIYGDADLLAAEFDAIVAAEWPQPPGEGAGRGAAGRHPGGGSTRGAADPVRGPVSRPRHPGIGGWARQRSPPLRHATHDRQEGR
jgi:hypothetical protein